MANEKRLIYADMAENLIRNYGKVVIDGGKEVLDPVDDIVCLVNGVDLIPTVDAVEVVHGRWMHHESDIAYCSNCEVDAVEDGTNYCPNCGAKMDLEG